MSPTAKSMPKKTKKEFCFYCNGVVTTQGRGDHFPIPFRHGGTETVSCCISCHDMKDRIRLVDWDGDWWKKVAKDFPNMSRETRIFLAKTICVCLDAAMQPEIARLNGARATTPSGKAMFQMFGMFAKFERAIMHHRIKAGLERARAEGKQIGRPKVSAQVEDRIRELRSTGLGMLSIAKQVGVGTGTVQRVVEKMHDPNR